MEVLMKQYWRHALAGAAAIVAMLATAGTASAGVLVKTTTDCSGQALSTPFTPWLDRASYTPLPGGTFEGGAAGWKLSGGAKVVAGNESFKVQDPVTGPRCASRPARAPSRRRSASGWSTRPCGSSRRRTAACSRRWP
jgi:hypothetical protein